MNIHVKEINNLLNKLKENDKELNLARRKAEFPDQSIQYILCKEKQIEKMLNIERISLYDNSLISLDGIESFEKLKYLKSIDIGKNVLTKLPNKISALQALREIKAEDNFITEINLNLCRLTYLNTLKLSGNRITSIPYEISQLVNLETLALDNNFIKEIPSAIGELINLKSLNLRKNYIRTIPEDIGKLEQLNTLILSSNLLTEVLPISCFGKINKFEKIFC